jgi:hypothetical protein
MTCAKGEKEVITFCDQVASQRLYLKIDFL